MEEDTLSFAHWNALQETFPDAELVDISGLMMEQRLVKCPEEIELTRQGAEVCIAAVEAMDKTMEEGAAEIEVAAAGESAMQAECAKRFPDFEYTGGQGICRSGRRSLYTHTGPSGNRLKQDELVVYGATPNIMGYYHTLVRQRILGDLPSALERPFQVQSEAYRRCVEAIKPGVKCSAIDRVALQVFEDEGFGQYKGYGTGHSFGIMGAFWGREEGGELRLYNDNPLQEGMIVSLEPTIYVPELESSLITVDMVLVTEDGCQVLTEYPRELTRR